VFGTGKNHINTLQPQNVTVSVTTPQISLPSPNISNPIQNLSPEISAPIQQKIAEISLTVPQEMLTEQLRSNTTAGNHFGIMQTVANTVDKAKTAIESVVTQAFKPKDSFPGYVCEDPAKRTWKTIAHRNAQLVAFTRWINYHLKDKNHSIKDISDLADGVTLVYLVEALTNAVPPDVIIPITGPRDKLQNITSSLQFFSEQLKSTLPP